MSKILSFIGFDGKRYILLPGGYGALARYILHRTLIKELKKVPK